MRTSVTPAELGDRRVRVVERLAVEAVLVLDRRDALPLHRPRDDDRRLPARRDAPGRTRASIASRSCPSISIAFQPNASARATYDVEVPADHRLAALAEPVDVDDRGEVVELEVRGVLERLPHRALGHLAVAAEHPDAARQALEVLAGERHPDADREALPERAGRDVDPRDGGCRMALEHASERAVLEDVLVGDDAGRAVDRVEEGRRVALREDEPVVRGALRLGEVVSQVAVDEDGQRGRLRTSRTSDAPTSRRRSCAPSRRGTAARALAVFRSRSRAPFYGRRSDAVTLRRGAQQIARAVRARRQRLGRLALARDARDGRARTARSTRMPSSA